MAVELAQSSIVDSSGLFKLDSLINLNIKTHSFYEVGLKKFIVVASENELVFLFISPQGDKNEKKYGWDFSENNIHCMCFEPTGTWILIVSDQKLFLAPFLPLFIPHQTYDFKWPSTDLTVIPLGTINKQTAVVWWLTKESENVVIIGTQVGTISFFSLDAKRIVGETKIPDAVIDLQISIDDSLDLLVLLITGSASQQWKLVLEHRSLCYNWLVHNSTIQDKEKKEGFMSYFKQLSKDKMSIFSQSSSKDSKTQNIEYTAKPVEYLPQFRKGSNNWALSVQYVNGRHFLTAFEMNEGTMILESTEEETPTRTFGPEIGKQGGYLQGLWSQRLIYILKKKGVEIHSSSLSLLQDPTMVNGTKRWTALWDVELSGDFLKAYVLAAREPTPEAEGWYEPTFTCDLQLPRFTMEPCLIITTQGVYLLSTLMEPAEWLVGLITRGGVNAEEWAAALAAPMPQLLRAAADLLLSRGKVAPAQYLYTLSQSKTDGWIARLGVFGRLPELVAYKPMGHNFILSNAAVVMKILAQLLKIAIDGEKIELDKKFLNLSQQELQELCSFAAAVGLWDLLPTLSIYQGYTDLFLASILHKSVYCRGAFNCLIRQKHVVPLLLEDNGLNLLAYIRDNYDKFDMRLLKRMCLWLCPLQDQLRPVLRDLKQGIVNKYTSSMDPLIHTFVKLLCAIEEKEPCPEIDAGTQKDSGTWKEQFVPRRVLSCGLSHWAIADGDDGKVMWANTPIKIQLIGRVISVACGRHHTLILTENGIYGAGDNSYGQLGVGAAWGGLTGDSAGTGGGLFYVIRTWQAPLANISAGHYHSAAIDVGGRLYTWGWGVHGQLGLGTIDDQWSPQLVTKLQGRKVVTASCGSCHTLALMKNGEVWAWGAGVFGQLGSGARDKASVPQRIALADPVEAIAAGYFHNLALTSKGQLYTWGASPQLIRAAHARRSLSPMEPTSPPPSDQIDPHLLPALVDTKNIRGKIVQVAAGWHHSCLIDDLGAVYTWGLNFDGQLGSGDRKQVCVPTEIRIDLESPPESMSNENLTSIKPFIALKTNTAQKTEGEGAEMNTKTLIACGGDFTVYVDENGRVFVTGNMHQQATAEGGKSCNRVIMMKTTKRVIKIPANRNCNKYLFQPVDRLDLIFNYKFSQTKRNDMEPYGNPLCTLSDFRRKSWADEIILCLKPWIKEQYVAANKNIAAKLAYHNNMHSDCLKYLLETLNRADITESLYLKHPDDSTTGDGPSSLKKEDVKATINIVTSKRIKEIGLTILNEQPYPTNSALVLAVLPCCCDELKYLPRGISHTHNFVHEKGPLSVRASIVIDKCLKKFPMDTNLLETCFRIAVEYYLKCNLPVTDLEPILKKYMDKDITALVSAIMFSNDCAQHSELFTPTFYLNMCSKLMDTWG